MLNPSARAFRNRRSMTSIRTGGAHHPSTLAPRAASGTADQRKSRATPELTASFVRSLSGARFASCLLPPPRFREEASASSRAESDRGHDLGLDRTRSSQRAARQALSCRNFRRLRNRFQETWDRYQTASDVESSPSIKVQRRQSVSDIRYETRFVSSAERPASLRSARDRQRFPFSSRALHPLGWGYPLECGSARRERLLTGYVAARVTWNRFQRRRFRRLGVEPHGRQTGLWRQHPRRRHLVHGREWHRGCGSERQHQ